MTTSRETDSDPAPLTARQRTTLRAVCDTLVPSVAIDGPDAEFYRRSASDLGVDHQIADWLVRWFDSDRRAEFVRLLGVLDNRAWNLLLTGRPRRFSELDLGARTRYLAGWRDSRLPVKRSGFQAVKRLACFLFYSAPGSGAPNPNWPAVGYRGSPPESPASVPSAVLLRPLTPHRELEVSVDACVVGSGAGGSVVARELARTGARVLVVEAGPYADAPDLRPNEFDATQRLFDGAGTLATRDLAFQLLAGVGAGGGTSVNWMTCLRPPQDILREWEEVYGIAGLLGPAFAADVEDVWRSLGVNDRESQRNPNNEALWRGCQALGYREGSDFHRIWRNAVGCRARCGFCGFGCPFGCKQSATATYLPDAQRAGARFLFNARADGLELEAGRVRAVRATYCAEGGARIPVRIACRTVVVAAGAVQTPALLLRSGLRAGPIGRGLRLHPTAAVAGEYATEIRCWEGPPQSVAVTRLLSGTGSEPGFWIEAAPAHPGLFALAVPWQDGLAHKEWMQRRMRRSSATIVLLREKSRGRIRTSARGNPIVEYRLSAIERSALLRGCVEAGRILAAAGARSLSTLHSAPLEVGARDGIIGDPEISDFERAVRARGAAPNRLLLFSAHLMGSCPMGSDPRSAAVRPTGELWSAENVYVADASVFPTSPGVNPMITIMAMAHRTARFVTARIRGLDGHPSANG